MATEITRQLLPGSGFEDSRGLRGGSWKSGLVFLGRWFGRDLIRRCAALLRGSRGAKAPAGGQPVELAGIGAGLAPARAFHRPKAKGTAVAHGTTLVPLGHPDTIQREPQVGRTTAFAHDLNNLLSIVQVNLQLLDREIANEDQRALIKDAHEATVLCDELIEGLCAERSGQVVRRLPLDINRELALIDNLIRKCVGPEIEVEQDLAENLGTIGADPTLFRNAVLNLVANARDSMTWGGRLVIATSNVEIDASAASSHIDAKPGAYVMLSLRDTGTGIAPEILRRVFDPYFTTKTPGRSMGVGLTLVREFCQRFEGFVRVDSEVGRGTIVSVYLPRHDT